MLAATSKPSLTKDGWVLSTSTGGDKLDRDSPEYVGKVKYILLGRIACTQYIDAAYCYKCRWYGLRLYLCVRVSVSVCMSVCLLVATVSPTKRMNEIEVPFRMWTRVSPRNRVLGGCRIPAGKRAIWGG